jgi:transcriptional regulator with XRE-family HTH domain
VAIKVGKKIRSVRKQRGYTQYQLADAVNADVSTINKIENDKANPSLDMLEKIATALNVKVIELLEEQAS